jgi:hypothetical protein
VADIADLQLSNRPNQRQQTVFKQRIIASTILRMGKPTATNGKYLNQPTHVTPQIWLWFPSSSSFGSALRLPLWLSLSHANKTSLSSFF